jgi:hypothetical protein
METIITFREKTAKGKIYLIVCYKENKAIQGNNKKLQLSPTVGSAKQDYLYLDLITYNNILENNTTQYTTVRCMHMQNVMWKH